MFRLLLCVALFSAAFSQSILDRFHEWASAHKISLPESDDSFLHMLENWRNNDLIIKETNAKNLTYTLGHNHFSGMNSGEFAELMRFRNNRELFADGASPFGLRGASSSDVSSEEQALPASVDWRTEGVVSPVQNQLAAGTCFSFSTTAAVETALAIKTGKLTKMSEQEIVDCSTIKNGGPNMGVNGGQIAPTFTWIGKTGGLCTEQAYPYVSGTTGKTGTCQNTCSKVAGSAVSSVVNVKPKSDTDLMTALTKTIVSIAIEADQPAFQLYKSGIFTAPCGTNLDHAVALVGYGTMNGLDYYFLRNSWGLQWAENGYMMIARGLDTATGKPYNSGAGQCGLLLEASYPVM